MYLTIDPSNGNPVYLQIMEQIKRGVAIGIFEVGKAIPPIREIALELRVNPNTVAKAIKELEHEGIVKTFVGRGTFITEKALSLTNERNMEKGEMLTKKYIKDVKWINLAKNDSINLINQYWDQVDKEDNNV